MDDIVVVEIVDGVEDLTDRLGRVLLRELALLADPVEQLSARRQLGDDVVFVLRKLGSASQGSSAPVLTLDSNQSWNLTMCGCFMRCSISSSS
jgi:hypothetical protein